MSNIFLFLTDSGRISPYLVYFLLLLPVIATLVAFARQVIGIKMFGAYAPIIATYAFLGTGLASGLIISFIIFLASLILRVSTKTLRIHYLPRMSLLISMIAIILLILLPLSIHVPIISISTIDPTAVILLLILSDIYLTAEIQQGYKSAGKMYVETIVVAAVIYLLVSWSQFQKFLISFPEVVLLCLILSLIIGRWKGLRLTEMYRFRTVIKEKAKDYA